MPRIGTDLTHFNSYVQIDCSSKFRQHSDRLMSLIRFLNKKSSNSLFNVLAESFLDEFMDDRPSLQTFQASVTQGASADVSISDSKELTEDQAPSSSSFVVMICVLF